MRRLAITPLQTLRHARAAALLACTVIASACTGNIDGSARSQTDDLASGAPSSGAGGGNGEPGSGPGGLGSMRDPSLADDAMRAADPELFELAARYFPADAAAGSPPRLFRLTRAQLDHTTRTLLPSVFVDSVTSAMPSDPLQTNYEYSDHLSWNAASLPPYAGWVRAIASRVEQEPSALLACASATDTACLQAGAETFVARAFRGLATPMQLARFSSFFVQNAAERGLGPAAADLVDVTLTSPSYVLRDEHTVDASGELLPAQRLQSLSYALTDAPPETLALDAALPYDALTDTVLASALARDKLTRFFLAWLEVKAPDAFDLAPTVFPEWTPAVALAATRDTEAFLTRALSEPQPSLKAITQAREAFASPESAFLYTDGRSPVSEPSTRLALPERERLGIFTQPAVIASHSGPTNSRLVKRGVFFTRKIMCLPLGAPPNGINTTVPETPNATERQRIEVGTANSPCSGCHAFINPFGFMQESYDALGRFRTRDEAGLPIDPSIEFALLDEGPLSTQTSVEALRTLTASARFKQCFTRQVFRYYMGRDEQRSDDPVLRQMFFAFAKDDAQDLLAMLRILVGSQSFTARTEAP